MRKRGSNWRLLLLGLLMGCGFNVVPGVPDDTRIDSPIDMRPPDVPTDELLARGSAVIVVSRPTTGTNIFSLPFDTQAGFGTACPDTPTAPSRMLLAHPTLSYVYSVANSLDGLSVTCGAMTKTSFVSIGNPSIPQRISVDPTAGVGFMTIDGSGSIGLHRFVIDSAGVPTSVNNPGHDAPGGALAVDWAARQVLVAGSNLVWSYSLTPTFSVTPGSQETATGCGTPIDLVISSGSVYSFCADTGIVSRYMQAPFAAAANAGNLGAVDAVRQIGPTRVVAARISPPDLVIVDLGIPVAVNPSVPLTQRVTAMSVAPDGRSVVTAQQMSANESRVTVWSITGTSLNLVDSESVAGVVTSIAVTNQP